MGAFACISGDNKGTNVQRLPSIYMVCDDDKVEETEIKYIKGPLLGQGGFAKVWSALRISDGSLIAIKEIDVHVEDNIEQAAKEGNVLMKLNHRHILKYYGMKILEDKRQVKIFTEYCSGITMNKVRSFKGKLDESVIRVWMSQLFDAVSYCHELRICHQDIKPQNIFITPQGIKVIDFGSATLSAISIPNKNSNKRRSTNFEFTVLYVAPEALKIAMEIENKSGELFETRVKMDVWSLGCVMVELTTKTEVWTELNFENGYNASYRISSTDVIPKWNENVLSVEGNAFLGQLLNRDPVERPSAVEIKKDKYLDVVIGNDIVFST